MSGESQSKFAFWNGRRGVPDWVWGVVIALATGAVTVYATGVRNDERLRAETEARKVADVAEVAARESGHKTLAEQIEATAKANQKTIQAVQQLTVTVQLLEQRVAANEKRDDSHHKALHMPLAEKLQLFESKPEALAHKEAARRVMAQILDSQAEYREEQRAMREDIKTILRSLPKP